MPLTADQLSAAYEQYAGPLRGYCYRRLHDRDAAEDMVQRVFLEATTAADRYEDRGISVGAWLFTIARARMTDLGRSETRRPTSALDETAPISDTRDDIGTLLTSLAGQEDLTGALDMLTPDQRQVITLRYLEDRSHDEIARALDISVGSVKAFQHHALAKLHGHLQSVGALPVALRRRILPRARLPRRVRRERLRYRAWSEAEHALLLAGYARGERPEEIARRLDRTPNAVKIHANRHGLRRSDRQVLKARDVAVVLGAKCAKTVTRWIQEQFLVGTRHGRDWRVTWADLLAFLQRREYWMAWHPERITDDALRAWATELRAGQPRWLTPGEVAARYHVTRNLINTWIIKFGLPATRYGNWWIWEADLTGWIPPYERERDWNRWHPRPGAEHCQTPACPRAAFYKGYCQACRRKMKEEAMLVAKTGRRGRPLKFASEANATTPQDCLLLALAVYGEQASAELTAHVDAWRGEPAKTNIVPVTLSRMAKIGSATRVSTGVYVLGSKAPLWARVLAELCAADPATAARCRRQLSRG